MYKTRSRYRLDLLIAFSQPLKIIGRIHNELWNLCKDFMKIWLKIYNLSTGLRANFKKVGECVSLRWHWACFERTIEARHVYGLRRDVRRNGI